MGTNGKNKPYCQLGKELDALARSRDVRGPYNIAHYLRHHRRPLTRQRVSSSPP